MRFNAKTRVCLKCKFHPGLHEGLDVRAAVHRTDDFLRTKISWMHRLPNFLTDVAPLRALGALESSAIKKKKKKTDLQSGLQKSDFPFSASRK